MKTKDITFDKFDQLDLERFAERLTDYIATERQFSPGGYILSLNGGFGTGKTTFFQMWLNKLSAAEEQTFEPMILNAWDADFLRDPLLSIKAINPTSRQLLEFIRIRTHVVQRIVKRKVRGNFDNYDAAIIMCLLSVKYSDLYRRLGSRSCEIGDLLAYPELLRGEHQFWDFSVSGEELRLMILWSIDGTLNDFEMVGAEIEQRKLCTAIGEYAFTGSAFVKNAQNALQRGLNRQQRRHPTQLHAAFDIIEEIDNF